MGARDETAAAIAALGEPGIWCHGLAFRPGKPTLLADCGGVPVIGLPGNPRSALVVFRVLGVPIVRLVGACTEPPPEPSQRARPAQSGSPVRGGPRRRRAGPRARGRGDTALRILALLSILTDADGTVVPEAATGLPAGSEVEVTLYR